jgi:hypothetical protein
LSGSETGDGGECKNEQRFHSRLLSHLAVVAEPSSPAAS